MKNKLHDMPTLTIPWQSLSEDALTGVIEEFVSREGTEYGAAEVSISDKYQQVRNQLEKGEAIITFDDESLSCSIILANQLPG